MQFLLLQGDYTITVSISGLIISIIVAIIIYNDAKDRNMDPTIYILLTCCCSFCCGGCIYLIAASDHPKHPPTMSRPQPSGGQPMYGRPQPPPQPGVPPSPPPSYPPAGPQVTNQTYMPPGAKVCPHCGQPVVPADAKFCSNCGNQMY